MMGLIPEKPKLQSKVLLKKSKTSEMKFKKTGAQIQATLPCFNQKSPVSKLSKIDAKARSYEFLHLS